MTICFVVLAHHQPQMFRRLIQHLSGAAADVVVHIDKRSDIKEFYISGLANVHFMENRKTVHRSGWSLTRTICEALAYGLGVSNADYFIYLAGTDFPIQRHEKIIGFLSERHPTNFLNWYPLVPGLWYYSLIDRYWLNDLKAYFIDVRNPAKSDASKVRRAAREFVNKAERMLNARFQPRNTTWTNFYSGSSRWCLNRETVRFVVDYYQSNKSLKLRNYLRLCANSDEIFFQTAILNSRPHQLPAIPVQLIVQARKTYRPRTCWQKIFRSLSSAESPIQLKWLGLLVPGSSRYNENAHVSRHRRPFTLEYLSRYGIVKA